MARTRGVNFPKRSVLSGLHIAMNFGMPVTAEDRITFFLPREVDSGAPKDQDNVPFNPDAGRTFSDLIKKQAPAAVEYLGKGFEETNLGDINADRIKVTMLGPDYVKIAGFQYVVIAGNKYNYEKHEPLIALGEIDVHIFFCRADDVA